MENRTHYLVDIFQSQEDDGRLIVVEANKNPVPFEIKRIFWIRDIKKGATRGEHASKKTKQILIAINGECDIEVDTGKEKKTYHLADPTKGVYVDEMIWRVVKNSSDDCIVMAICNHEYELDNDSYGRYEEFLDALERGE